MILLEGSSPTWDGIDLHRRDASGNFQIKSASSQVMQPTPSVGALRRSINP